MMNIKLLKRLRTRFLRMRHPEHFDMTDYARTTACGTAFCIAGHALDLQGYKVRGKGSYLTGGIEFISPEGKEVLAGEAAQKELGLTNQQASELFGAVEIVTPKQAAARIQELIDAPGHP